MKYVVLDTSVLVNCSLLSTNGADPELLETIVERMRGEGATLLLPEVVRLEYGRKMPEQLKHLTDRMTKYRSSVSSSDLPSSDVQRIHELLDKIAAQREHAAEASGSSLESFIADKSLTQSIELTPGILVRALRYALGGVKPAAKRIDGFIDADSLIVASIAEFCEKVQATSDDVVLLCSDNHRDFAVWDEASSSHVVAPPIDASIGATVRYYKNPRELLELELGVDVSSDKALDTVLAKYDNISRFSIADVFLADQEALKKYSNVGTFLESAYADWHKERALVADSLQSLIDPIAARFREAMGSPHYAFDTQSLIARAMLAHPAGGDSPDADEPQSAAEAESSVEDSTRGPESPGQDGQ